MTQAFPPLTWLLPGACPIRGRIWSPPGTKIRPAGSVRPFGSIILPLDDIFEELFDPTVVLMAGVQVPIAAR